MNCLSTAVINQLTVFVVRFIDNQCT